MKRIPLVVAVSLFGCGTAPELSAAEQQLSALSDALHASADCGLQNAACHRADASVAGLECRARMRVCISAFRAPLPMHRAPELDALHACNAAYSACAGDDDDDGGTPVDCDAAHRACLCTVFTSAWADFCAQVAATCGPHTSRHCARLTARCADPTPPPHALCP